MKARKKATKRKTTRRTTKPKATLSVKTKRKVNGKMYYLVKKIANTKAEAIRDIMSLKRKGVKDVKAIKRVYGKRTIYLMYVRFV